MNSGRKARRVTARTLWKIRPLSWTGTNTKLQRHPAFVQVAALVDRNTIEVVGKKDGQVVGKATYAVSPDTRVLTARVWGTDFEQRTFNTMIVWDRVTRAAERPKISAMRAKRSYEPPEKLKSLY
jgi:hypothetical protein